MKKVMIIIALTLFLKPILPVLEYAINYDYITKVLCINKNKPMMHCNGKCHLMKQLAKESENDKPIAPNKKASSQETEILFCMYVPTFEMPKEYMSTITKINRHYINLYAYTTTISVFHPPAV